MNTALVGTFAGRLVGFWENDINPRHFKRARIGGSGEGKERGNLTETTPKPPVAQRAGEIYYKWHIHSSSWLSHGGRQC